MGNSSKDFLYVNEHKVNNHLAQLEGFIVPSTSVIETTQEFEGTTNSDKLRGTVTKNRGPTGETHKTEDSKIGENSSHSQKSLSESSNYVHSYTYPIKLLSLLEERKLLKNFRKDELEPGDWILAKTNISLFDTEMCFSTVNLLVELWPFLQKAKNNKNNRADKNKISQIKTMIGAFRESLPVQLHFSGQSIETTHLFQGVLDEKNLTENPRSLILRHGTKLGGQWTILGIVDNLPSSNGLSSIFLELMNIFTEVKKDIDGQAIEDNISVVEKGMSLLGKSSQLMLDGWIGLVRNLVRYSEDGYYITPVLIYREMGKVTSQES